MITVGPASGGVGKGDQIVKVDMGNLEGIARCNVKGRQVELVRIGYVNGDGLLDILQEVAEYPDRLITG